ncbi:enoyl-CoA delta isomerase 1, mitochondrial-like [Achroia grisella]|uniref:enoyl-CoA delta isomerase 1, mitochondrial-like n=1 Tax=Achroia grisella TaxID=688607 RepID=UPI0027D284F4|nr:enoyl-CoA delta isomerase 1, mitochondrial-like [Achroia grisella]XP_059053913.1 enoyl-CoA delta isomerase 1, mitochondrial-like [Achroia grisella]
MNALRLFTRNGRQFLPNVRPMSAKAGPLVDLSVDNEGIATLTMQRLPVNSLNLELIQEIDKGLDEVANNKARGVILTSASSSVFSAGLDIMEMYKPDRKRVEQFWTSLQGLWLKLFGSKFITAAAINGHAPAGGCLLAMSCEYRVMVNGKFTTGLNETALGIVAPRWFMDTMCNTISKRDAEIALTTAKMFTVDEAIKVGLIDETATDKADSIEKCKQFINRFNRIPPLARAFTKQKIRGDALAWLQKNRQADLEEFLTFVTSPKVQQSLEVYLELLKQKSAKK